MNLLSESDGFVKGTSVTSRSAGNACNFAPFVRLAAKATATATLMNAIRRSAASWTTLVLLAPEGQGLVPSPGHQRERGFQSIYEKNLPAVRVQVDPSNLHGLASNSNCESQPWRWTSTCSNTPPALRRTCCSCAPLVARQFRMGPAACVAARHHAPRADRKSVV